MLREPLLYLSLYLKQNRPAYYGLLDGVRRTGDWEAWLAFFLEGVRETAEGAVATSTRLTDLIEEDGARIEGLGRRAGSALRVHEALTAYPVRSVAQVCEHTGLTPPTASSAMRSLIELGIAREITGRRRGRLFAYDGYISILNEGTEPE